jgi:hypothetical protein
VGTGAGAAGRDPARASDGEALSVS